MLRHGLFACLGVLMLAAPAQAQGSAKVSTSAPGFNRLCDAAQTAIWAATTPAWDRTKMRPGHVSCSFMGSVAFCVTCADKASIVLLPPDNAANPGQNRQFGSYTMGPAPTAVQISDRYPAVERATLNGGGQTTVVSVSAEKPEVAKALMATIRKNFRAPR